MLGDLMVQKKPSYSRRALLRVEASEDIWVCWHCNGCDDVSRVRNVTVEGLFIQTLKPRAAVGMTSRVDFLVQDGQIRADAVVRHVQDSGFGLRFTAIENRPHLTALIARLRSRRDPSPKAQTLSV